MEGDDFIAIYLNTNKAFENYMELVNEEYYVDKSSMITLLNKKISTKNKYMCNKAKTFWKIKCCLYAGSLLF